MRAGPRLHFKIQGYVICGDYWQNQRIAPSPDKITCTRCWRHLSNYLDTLTEEERDAFLRTSG